MLWRISDGAYFWYFESDNHLSLAAMRAAMEVDAGQPQQDLLRVPNKRVGDRSLRIHQRTDQGDVPALIAMEQKSEIADFDKAWRQHMQQKAPGLLRTLLTNKLPLSSAIRAPCRTDLLTAAVA